MEKRAKLQEEHQQTNVKWAHPPRPPQPAPSIPGKRNQNVLCLYSNWALFHKSSMEFFERQRSLLAMIRDDGTTNLSSVYEVHQHRKRTAIDILQRVEEMAGQLRGAQVGILVRKLVEEKERNEELQNELEKLKDCSSTGTLDHSELAERLEFQMARLADKDAQIAALKERLASQSRSAANNYAEERVHVGVDEDTDAAMLEELSAESILDLEPRSLIRHIRKELGIDLESFNPVHRRIIRALRGKLGCALEKLAHDIYSNDSQIVLELIQNADDNCYGDETAPFLSIHVRSGKSMFVTNNECGFSNADVVAISSIGASTKKDISRFTGHKGIGFKSAFKVTRTPYIISRDFCFRFNLDGPSAEDNVGYILPEWVEMEEIESLVAPERIDPSMTHFYFPFSESSNFPAEEFYRGVDLIPLFLRRLHRVELGLDNKTKVIVVDKEPSQGGPLEIYHLSVTETKARESGDAITETIRDIRYRVFRKMLDVPKDLQIASAGRMIPEKSELILAFPELSDTAVDPSEVEIQKVYSYLPVEKAGFRFLIQADFHLVSSRERVHAQSLYNRWLSAMIPAAFKEAFGFEDVAEREICAGALRYELFLFLPTPHELTRTGHSEASTDGFWRRVMKGIIDKVLDAPCCLTETSKWVKPCQVCVRPKGYEDLFTNLELQECLNKEWVSESLTEEAMSCLRCQYLNPSEALAIINRPSFCVTKRPTQWFLNVYGFLGSQIKNNSDFIDELFSAKMFPLVTGAITSLHDGPLYTMAPAGLYKIGSHVIRLLALDSAAFVPGDPVQRFLKSAGITTMSALDVANSIWVEHQRLLKPINDIPVVSTSNSCEQFWEQLRFLKDHWSDVAPLYPYLESKLLVPVYADDNAPADQTYYHFASFVYFTDVKMEFSAISPTLNARVLFLNDRYLNEDIGAPEKQAWIKFLTVQIGVNKSLRIIPTDDKEYACSQELDCAVQLAITDATENDSNSTWTSLLTHMQKNWENFKKAKDLIKVLKKCYSGFPSFPLRSLFPDLAPLKDLLLDKDGIPCIRLPAIPGLTNTATMSDLGIETTLDGNMLKRLAIYLEKPGKPDQPPVTDLFVWKKVYGAMVKHNAKPDTVFIPEANGPGKFEDIAQIRHEITPMLLQFCGYSIFPAEDYAEVRGMEKWFKRKLTVADYRDILVNILKTDAHRKDEYEEQILQCYRQINALLSGPTNNGCKFNLVLDMSCYLRGRKVTDRLVVPDRLDVFRKFITEPKRLCPIIFVHPELAKLENITTQLATSWNIPLLSKVMQACPVPSFWHGYHTYAIGTNEIELPVYLSSDLTNLYRALLAEIQVRAETLSSEERFLLGNLLRGVLVYVSAVDAPKVPVAYTVYGAARVCQEDYFIHASVSGQVSVIVSAAVFGLPVEDRVNLDVLKKLFPPLVVDDYLKTAVKMMLEQSVRPKLETLNIVQPNDELQMLPFQITVEDSETVKSVQKYCQNSRDSETATDIGNQRKYPVKYVPLNTYFGPGIPGLTAIKETKKIEPDVLSPSLVRRQLILVRTAVKNWQRRQSLTTTDVKHLKEIYFSHAPSSHYVENSTEKMGSSNAFKSELCKTPNVNGSSPRAHSSVEKIGTMDPLVAPDHSRNTEKVLRANSDIIYPAKTATSESKPPQAFGGNVPSTLQRIRNEIRSWSEISAEALEARLFRGNELQYAHPNHPQPSPNADRNFRWQLQNLESQGQLAELIGIWAEKAAFNHLLHLYEARKPFRKASETLGFPIRSFDMANWISSAREQFDTERRMSDDSKGYDLFFEQSNGTTVYVEVKGHAAMTNTFLLSSNEWKTAKMHCGNAGGIYVILGINLNLSTMEGARIAYILEDPVLLKVNGTIAKRTFNYLVELFPKAQTPADVPSNPDGACHSRETSRKRSRSKRTKSRSRKRCKR